MNNFNGSALVSACEISAALNNYHGDQKKKFADPDYDIMADRFIIKTINEIYALSFRGTRDAYLNPEQCEFINRWGAYPCQ